MKILSVSSNAEGQIQVIFKCFSCNGLLTLLYSMQKLREWAEKCDKLSTTATEERVSDDKFLHDMRIKGMEE
jgi:hypothetical protein